MNFSGEKRNASVNSRLSEKYLTQEQTPFDNNNNDNPLYVGTFSDKNSRTVDNSR